MTTSKFFANLVLLSSTVIFASSVAYTASITNSRNRQEGARQILKDQEGKSSFAVGGCFRDNDCAPKGCSNQICTSSKEDILTTCEFSESYPRTEQFSCGCVNRKCAWFPK